MRSMMSHLPNKQVEPERNSFNHVHISSSRRTASRRLSVTWNEIFSPLPPSASPRAGRREHKHLWWTERLKSLLPSVCIQFAPCLNYGAVNGSYNSWPLWMSPVRELVAASLSWLFVIVFWNFRIAEHVFEKCFDAAALHRLRVGCRNSPERWQLKLLCGLWNERRWRRQRYVSFTIVWGTNGGASRWQGISDAQQKIL